MQRELERDRVQGVAAEGAEHPLGQPGQPGRDPRRRDQGQLEGPRGQGAGQAALADRGLGDPQGADQGQRNDPDDEHELVGDERPGQPQRDERRHIPGRGRARSRKQPDEQDGNRGPDVTDAQQQGGDTGAELRRQHDPGGDRHPDHRGPAGEAAAGHQDGEQHGQRVGHRRGDVRGVRVDAEEDLQQGVLRQLSGIEGHVGQVPAVQQQVAVQHVRRGEQDVGLVGVLRLGPRQPEVDGEQGGREHCPGRSLQPAPAG